MTMRLSIIGGLCILGLAFASTGYAQTTPRQSAAASAAPAQTFDGWHLVSGFTETGPDLQVQSLVAGLYQSVQSRPAVMSALRGTLNDAALNNYATPALFEQLFRTAYGLDGRNTITRREFKSFLVPRGNQEGIILPGFANGRDQARLASLRQRQQTVAARVTREQDRVAIAAPPGTSPVVQREAAALASLATQLATFGGRLTAAERELRSGRFDAVAFNHFLDGVHSGLGYVDQRVSEIDQRLSALTTRVGAVESKVDGFQGQINWLWGTFAVGVLILGIVFCIFGWRQQKTSRTVAGHAEQLGAVDTRLAEATEAVAALAPRVAAVEKADSEVRQGTPSLSVVA
ncbi:hypothetical protein K2Q16_00765 [Patescibacteria group bacterium]|nr:hypothetical protein [Patescibacteria group bacterium]